MANILSPTNTVAAEVGAQHKAVRTSPRPPEAVNTLGAYRQSLFTGSVGAGLAANSEIAQFRYTGASLAMVKRIQMDTVCATTAFAAGAISFRLLTATGWSADGSGGSVLTTPLALDSRMAVPVASLRVATTTALGAGTKTLQGVTTNQQGIGINLGFTAPATPAVGVQMPAADLFNAASIYQEPAILQNNQGLVVVATVPATGVWITGFTIEWTEISSADWR